MAEFSPRVAVVTGAAQGIGLSIALRLADDGLDVAVNDIAAKSDQLQDVVAQIQAKGRRALSVPGDVSREDDVRNMIAVVVGELGGLDVMVANAGIAIHKPFVETSTEDWERIIAINLQGVMLCYKYAAIQMIKQGRGGRILGASSQAGKKGTTNLAAYSATKFAVRGLTQSVALELAPYNITVNAYAPGFIITALAHHPDDALNGGPGSTVKKMFNLPLDSPEAGPDTIASIVSYLAKPESHFITGQTILINGGVTFD
ncbi:NAD(P)-binding protein [Laetiporus sulphureus 93-53]|uniref:3-oxoacyl-[acyl-carrier-protein] reductase n=1 Tax=Laetiporus sulphureus 93-53 TaxID=1314785 RepID=A0A165BBH9_9APHY|nr:NAD(P)-binding protein [Laetiporus sulphureus 93-53]KZT00678.1 NAD(P)-binding protein [Laetiporus sulphureus 93-53]